MENMYMLPKRKMVSQASADEYEKNIPQMIEEVNLAMGRLNINENLIGNNPLSLMAENHEHHAKFMDTALRINDYGFLKNTLRWVLNSYRSRGFEVKYFQKELEVWVEVIGKTLVSGHSEEIIEIYMWMKNMVDEMSEGEVGERKIEYPYEPLWEERKDEFFDLLIAGKSSEVLLFSRSLVDGKESLEDFYTKVVTYAMYEVGLLWEKGLISVAQEHLSTSIVMRIMSSLYLNIVLSENTKGKVIVSASMNEYHEVGARVIGDLLELDGWQVIYLGANMPDEDLIELILKEKPDFINLSVTMTFNIGGVKSLISKIRSMPELSEVKILAGGYAFTCGIDLQEQIGADKISLSAHETIETARSWWREKDEF